LTEGKEIPSIGEAWRGTEGRIWGETVGVIEITVWASTGSVFRFSSENVENPLDSRQRKKLIKNGIRLPFGCHRGELLGRKGRRRKGVGRAWVSNPERRRNVRCRTLTKKRLKLRQRGNGSVKKKKRGKALSTQIEERRPTKRCAVFFPMHKAPSKKTWGDGPAVNEAERGAKFEKKGKGGRNSGKRGGEALAFFLGVPGEQAGKL